ncbi:methyltransferase domain-containing protein [Pseudomonas sp. PDM16]|uniref:class I SAM-dependent methyltransferase n=1 Tax=Pseudomonas sp. PDM16 TaxID=2769292 RepID=UPI00177F8EF3|nr:methyltransferase domain-containing protein [Pseudomonas sp. PDM16]MBD9416104.1 methyltransferase domain-containing protein [Pseudomonas sp. PDM16]
MLDAEIAKQLIVGRSWHHDFEIVPGLYTQGNYNPTGLWKELELPEDMDGISLADVGASNGFFSFEAHRRGARVTAFDFRHKDNSGFGLAQYINGLEDIEHHHANVLDISHQQYGKFDVVLALGLLYHVSDPYLALANCAGLSQDRLLIESYCIDALLPGQLADEPVMRFIPDGSRFPEHGQVNADRSNFWGFTSKCLKLMLEDVGFSVERMNVRGERVFIDARRQLPNERGTRLNMAYKTAQATPRGEEPDDPQAWKIF